MNLLMMKSRPLSQDFVCAGAGKIGELSGGERGPTGYSLLSYGPQAKNDFYSFEWLKGKKGIIFCDM